MSGRGRCLYALVLALFVGGSLSFGADGENDKKPTNPFQPEPDSISGFKILAPPPALKKGEKLSPEAAILRALETRVRAELVEDPLDGVCEMIEKLLKIPVVLDRSALFDEGLDPDTPLSCSMKNVRVRSCLDFILSEHDLSWTLDNEVLLITTKTVSQETLRTRVYDVYDLAVAPEPLYTDIDSLMEVITTAISPDSWCDVGGNGSISPLISKGIRTVAISQTFRVHEKIEKLLADLRSHIPKPASKNCKTAAGKPEPVCEAENIRQALRKKVDLNFERTPLSKVTEQIAQQIQIQVYIHKQSLADEGLDIDTPVTFRVSGISAAAALDLVLRDLDLGYMIQGEYLMILSKAAELELSCVARVYDVAELVEGNGSMDDLIETLLFSISPEHWDGSGGPGPITTFENAGMKVIVIDQIQQVHNDTERLLADLRKVRHKVDDDQTGPRGMRAPGQGMQGMGVPGMGPGMGMEGPGMGGPGMGIQGPGMGMPGMQPGMGGGFRPDMRPGMTGRGFGGGGFGMPDNFFDRPRTRKIVQAGKNPARDELVKGSNQFAFELYGKLAKDKPGKNVFFSPMSISTAMGMAYAGARGKTAEEIARTMHFTLPKQRLHAACRSLIEVSQGSGSHELNIANNLWVQNTNPNRKRGKEHQFLDSFLDITRKQYAAECRLVDFVGNREETRQRINSLVTRQTQGRIRNLIEPGLIDHLTRLVLTNSIHFKGRWQWPFETRTTKPDFFFAPDGKKPVNMMSMLDHNSRHAKIDETGLQILEKPYGESGNTSMLILLPGREPGSLARLESSLSEEKLADLSKRLVEKDVQIHLPRFRMETDYPLKDQLSEMGMRLAFSSKDADFSGMDGARNLFLQFVVHSTFIQVDEYGTEAAAATGMGAGMGGPPPKPIEFRADHPFIFLIRDNSTGSILFLGRFHGPELDTTPVEPHPGGGMF